MPLLCTAWKVFVFGVFLVRIFPHSDWIRRDTKYLSVFSPNVGKYGPEKLQLQIRTLSTQCWSDYWEIVDKGLSSDTSGSALCSNHFYLFDTCCLCQYAKQGSCYLDYCPNSCYLFEPYCHIVCSHKQNQVLIYLTGNIPLNLKFVLLIIEEDVSHHD